MDISLVVITEFTVISPVGTRDGRQANVIKDECIVMIHSSKVVKILIPVNPDKTCV